MADYRAYTLGDDGRIVGLETLTCTDDREAMEKASHLTEGHAVELWCGDRFVISAAPPSARN
jgi:hypothetical protein